MADGFNSTDRLFLVFVRIVRLAAASASRMMKHHQHMRAVRPEVAGFLCLTTFIFGYTLNLRSNPYHPSKLNSYITAEHTLGASSYLMRAGLAERCSQHDIERQVELFKVAAGNMKSRCAG